MDNDVMKVGGLTIYGASKDQGRVLLARDAFIDAYCAEKGWNKDALSMAQILEIRSQPGWKNPQ